MKHAQTARSFHLQRLYPSRSLVFLHCRFSSTQPARTPTFESIGVDTFVTRGLEKAFPHVKIPTPTQEQFIPAILSGKDVLLQDKTGTGKSLGLLLALLSKPRASRLVAPRHWKDRATDKAAVKEAITSILIVPHNDLAHQFTQWIKSMRLTTSPRQLVQTLLKDGTEDYNDQLARLAKEPPHILITTPKALDDCWSKGKQLFTLDSVSTVVLEEADSLLRVPSNNTPLEVQKRWRKHPPVVRELLSDIFKARPKHRFIQQEADRQELQPRPRRSVADPTPVQMVLVSATLRPAVRKYLFLETKWLSQVPGETVQIEGTREMDRRQDPVRHYGLFVDVTGSIRNLRDPEDEEDVEVLDEASARLDAEEDEVDHDEEPGDATVSVEDGAAEALLWNGNRLASQLMDAVVSMFALDVPEYALLIIPSNVSALRTVEDLEELGVTAVNLDDYAKRPKETLHRIKIKSLKSGDMSNEDNGSTAQQKSEPEGQEDTMVDNPIMLVAIQGAVRGIDLPQISHVFIAGVPESEVDYVHLAGRVGRMGAKSAPGNDVKKVITFLPEPDMNPLIGAHALKRAQEPRKRLERMWNMLEIKASIYAKAL